MGLEFVFVIIGSSRVLSIQYARNPQTKFTIRVAVTISVETFIFKFSILNSLVLYQTKFQSLTEIVVIYRKLKRKETKQKIF